MLGIGLSRHDSTTSNARATYCSFHASRWAKIRIHDTVYVFNAMFSLDNQTFGSLRILTFSCKLTMMTKWRSPRNPLLPHFLDLSLYSLVLTLVCHSKSQVQTWLLRRQTSMWIVQRDLKALPKCLAPLVPRVKEQTQGQRIQSHLLLVCCIHPHDIIFSLFLEMDESMSATISRSIRDRSSWLKNLSWKSQKTSSMFHSLLLPVVFPLT